MKLKINDLKTKNLLKKTKKEFENFFSVKIKEPKIFLYNSRKEINKFFKKETPDWLVGWARDGNIHILCYEKFLEESNHKDREDYWRTLKHELVHLYFKEKINDLKPLWLNEGLACFLAGQNKKTNFKGVKNLKFYYEKNNAYIYNFGFHMVNSLIVVFGEEKFKSFLDKIALSKKTINTFNKLFKKEFDISVFAFWHKIKNQVE
ncbi:MAG: hypothetical protein WC414_02000 [Patescibacteria group bacterium]